MSNVVLNKLSGEKYRKLDLPVGYIKSVEKLAIAEVKPELNKRITKIMSEQIETEVFGPLRGKTFGVLTSQFA